MRQSALVTLGGIALLVGVVAVWAQGAGGQPAAPVRPPDDGPLTYLTGTPGVLIYVESDRRHVSAVTADGKLLWHVDVTDAVRLKERGGRPARVKSVTKPLDTMARGTASRPGKPEDFVAVGLTTKEFGLLSLRDGRYTSLGND